MQLLLQCYIQCGGIGQLEWNKCKCNAPRVCYQEIQLRILTLLETAGSFSFTVNDAGFFEVVEVWSGTTLKTNWIYKIYFGSFMRASFTFSYLDLKRIVLFPSNWVKIFMTFFFASRDPKRFGRAEIMRPRD